MVSASAGSVTVRVNGVPVLSLSGVNTLGNASGTVQRYGVGSPGGTSEAWSAHWYLCDNTGPAPGNTFLGDTRVQTLVATGSDAVAFAPSGQPANWQNAALVPPVPGTDYNSSAVAGAQDTFNCSAVAAGLGTVFGVNTKALLAKSDAGPRTMATVLKSGAAVAVGPTVSVGVSAQQARLVTRLDPNTGLAWTPAAVNAAKPGYRIVA